MDWKEDPQSNIYLFPRGMHKKGGLGEHSVRWTSRYGSVVTAGYDIGTCDGMNERGLVANLLFLTESSYTRPNDDRPVMGPDASGPSMCSTTSPRSTRPSPR